MNTHRSRSGLTLLELVVVLVILVALAGIVVPLVSNHGEEARQDVTRETLRRLQEVINNRYWADMDNVLAGVDGGYPHPAAANSPPRQHHPQLRYLFINPANETATQTYDPVSRRDWRGPYLQHDGATYTAAGSFTNAFGETGDPTVLDGWARPVVMQRPTAASASEPEKTLYTRLLSAGADGVISTPADQLLPDKSFCGDDVVLYLRVADTRPAT